MALVSDWYDEVMSQVMGCPEDVLELSVRRSLQEFARFTNAWRHEHLLDVKAGKDRYDVHNYQGGVATTVLTVMLDGRRLSLSDGLVATASEAVRPYYAVVGKPGVVYLRPVPTTDRDKALMIEAAYQPSDDAERVPDEFYTRWYEVVLQGILGRLYMQAAKPWSNQQLATLYQRQFRAGMAQVRDEAQRHYSRAERSWSFPRWA